MSGATPQSAQQEKSVSQTAKAFAAQSPTSGLAPSTIRRRIPGVQDVQIDILYCGVCHSDLHQARNEWQSVMPTVYPCVPGHEIVGRVVKTGNAVTKFKAGDIAAVGCMVDSCRKCASCRAGEEQYCDTFPTLTYNGEDKQLGGVTYGGYSESIVVDEAFVLRVSEKLNLAGTAPLLCAGITTYSPLRHFGVKPGDKVAVVGLGGLGHMGVKLAKALGAHVTVLSHSPGKRQDALRLGAEDFIATNDPAVFEKNAGRFDFILDTVSAKHDYGAYLGLLRRDGTMVLVGAPDEPSPLAAMPLLAKRRRLAGSAIGGIRETQEMLDFCAKHGIATAAMRTVERTMKVNAAFKRICASLR